MSEALKKALSDEEWGAAWFDRLWHTRAWNDLSDHAKAATLLHGQPFGFTWEMVDALNELGHYNQSAESAELAARAIANIAALLPPR